MPIFLSFVFVQCFLIVVTLSGPVSTGNTWRPNRKQLHSPEEKHIHAFTDDDEPKRRTSKLASLMELLLTLSGPTPRIVGLGKHHLHSHAMRSSKRGLGTRMIEKKLEKLLKVAPELGSVLALRRGRALEIDGTALAYDQCGVAIADRQVQSAIVRSGWEEVRESVFDSAFPKNVNELKEVLRRPNNGIWNYPGTRLQRSDLNYEEILGKGAQGVVYKRKYTVNGRENVYAVKAIPFNPDYEWLQVRMVVKEIRTMVMATDKHMVKLHDVYFMDVWNGTALTPAIHMVMDCGIGNYHGFIEDLAAPAWDSYRYEAKLSDMLQMCLAIRAMHRVGIAHRDLKPGNVVTFPTSDGSGVQLKLIDFGGADGPGVGGSFYSKELRGTPEFVSPEVAENFIKYQDPPNMVDGRAMDLWALGITLYKLLTREYPFRQGSTGKPIEDIEFLCEDVLRYRKYYPASVFTFEKSPMAFKAKHIINGLLHPNPELRMSIDETIREVSKALRESLLEARHRPSA